MSTGSPSVNLEKSLSDSVCPYLGVHCMNPPRYGDRQIQMPDLLGH